MNYKRYGILLLTSLMFGSSIYAQEIIELDDAELCTVCAGDLVEPTTILCGDGIVQWTEECDDGNQIEDDGCTNRCQKSICWDGELDPGEQCDDGNLIDTDACTNRCVRTLCGDWIINNNEECDDAASNGQLCDLTWWSCTYCTITCQQKTLIAPNCWDGTIDVQLWEQCDDGNDINDDMCTNSCRLPVCGDGIVQSTEQCDDASNNGVVCEPWDDLCTYCGEACTIVTYRTPTCGDGVKNSWEECDDANDNNSDSCSNDCKIILCGDGVVTGTEQCDEWSWNTTTCNTSNGACTYCSMMCTEELLTPVCGNGQLEWTEACDDGNSIDGDWCDMRCRIEPKELLDTWWSQAFVLPESLPETWANFKASCIQ